MKAVTLKEIGKPLEIIEKDKPQPGEGEVLVQVKAAALNHRDVWIQKGQYASIKVPAVPGSDGAGVVVETGEGVDDSWLGKEVIIDPATNWGDNPRAQGRDFKILGMPQEGTFAEYVKVPATNLYGKPEHLSFEEAAAVPLGGVTAYRALFTRCNLQEGERVLVTGAGGGVALFAVQFAVAAGAEVWVTSGAEEKVERAKLLGAKGGVNYKTEDWGKKLKEQAGGFDVMIDSAGGEGFAQLVRLANPGARIGIYGRTAGTIPSLNPAEIFWKQISINGSTMGTAQDFADMVQFISDKTLKPVIDKVFPLEEAERAFRRMDEGQQFGKIVLKLD
ncbi:NADPH:quinone reductase-like Zn-dependent oxidoreductase [Pontibacter ummariensis]|uniref:NADPH:quinone reductase n=1 Tax=Pontibacter ummariensis TaxID=1610492 RepID=A0A239BFK2_9BACT|nr:zinc-binding dehydrogenase [Pontibacter ummariensis]PRY16500.1 NADPH:quinone reductase-like Zn-dependent oxidoreductase [Pontibacter ummariensis]SNS06281.1 NADPH:quinone reductase [Pontibacter ummariensis]